MKFDDFDKKMRVYEQSLDLPGLYIVCRLDGRGFTRLTKEIAKFEAPFDARFRDMMIETMKHLMDCGFQVRYGYTESDEISLLFSLEEASFARKIRKFNSILASEAGATFSLLLGRIATFDCRVVPLPNIGNVKDYFLWRQEDAHRNALNAHCYWMLRKEGMSMKDATVELEGKSVAFKNELLFTHGINFNDLPTWQKRGIGVYFEACEKTGVNAITSETVIASRRRLKVDLDLPLGTAYAEMVAGFLEENPHIQANSLSSYKLLNVIPREDA